jgi:cell division protein FtsW
MAVVVNLLPVTGQPLPMISMGGSSLLFTCIALGIIQSVSRGIKHQQEVAEQLTKDTTEHGQEVHN